MLITVMIDWALNIKLLLKKTICECSLVLRVVYFYLPRELEHKRLHLQPVKYRGLMFCSLYYIALLSAVNVILIVIM